MSAGGVSEREFGQLEQKVESLPTNADLRAVVLEVQRLLEKHEERSEKFAERTATQTVESAFKLQWTEIERHLKANQGRDWLPYIMAAGVILLAGAERAIPFVLKVLTGA